ncbi:MAG: phosphatase PAP2 family protein [Desulfuromonadales bacterium]|nr:phosphatase PAP2 family protein [Desulfuromonadales bacterium]
MILFVPLSAFSADNPTVYSTIVDETFNGAHRLADETVVMATTPFKIENGNILLTLGAIGATSLTYVFDRDVQNNLSSRKSKSLDKAADVGSVVGNPFIHLGVAALVYGLAIADDSPKWKETGEMMGEALILADASSFIIKQSVGRGRPNATSSKNNFKPFGFKNDYDSFPSMHTASSFALASVLAATSESLATKTAYYLAASFVAFSRTYQNKHWASDVVFGAVLGELCGRVVTNYHASGRHYTIAPQAYESGAGLALVGTW